MPVVAVRGSVRRNPKSRNAASISRAHHRLDRLAALLGAMKAGLAVLVAPAV